MLIPLLQHRCTANTMPKDTNHKNARINPVAPVNPTDWKENNQNISKKNVGLHF